jgi:hypothetical protein
MKKKLIIIILFTYSFLFGQNINSEIWDENEIAQYSKLVNLAKYVHNIELSKISKDSLFDKYIYFDYVLNDTLSERRERRLKFFDTIFYRFKKKIDSIGLENLDAKPVRFYKKHKIYQPFDKEIAQKSVGGEKMYTQDSNVFAYYKKKEPDNPLGTLLFEVVTDKLVTWIMINQGGYKYFLTFNLL